MNSIIEWFKELWQGFVDWLIDILIIVLTFFKDLALNLLELFLDGLIFVFAALTPPEFITTGLSTVASAIPEPISYFLSQSGFAEGLAIYGLGISFRLLRKLFTLGQW